MISVTEDAANWISGQLHARGKGEGIRLATKTSGCSGYMYIVEFVDIPDDTDSVFNEHGIKVFVDPKSLLYLDGTNLEFKTEGLNSGLSFTNPNSTGECGCGESFAV
jgi:iron-sulfur cluster assembly protein